MYFEVLKIFAVSAAAYFLLWRCNITEDMRIPIKDLNEQ